MKFIKNSIRTKFIVLISILMAVILALQFYFMNQTQQNMLSELANLSRSINQTTDNILIREFELPSLDSLRLVLDKEKENIEEHREMAERLSQLNHKQERKLNTRKKIMRWKNNIDNDQEVEEVEIQLSPEIQGKDSFIFKSRAPLKEKIEHSVFSINVPDFSKPKTPRLLRYKYSTASVEGALSEIYWRNLVITLIIFGVSLLLIIYITRRFLMPIENLRRSFENVVQGDLSVQVQNSSSDEIGSLTRSFNSMVGELQKNRQKEKLFQRKERLASLGQLAAGVAHEIKNPLNAINLTISHLNDKFIPKNNATAEKYIQTVQMEIQRLDKIVNNFLNYLRSEDLKKESVNIAQLLEQILQLYEREISANEISVEKNLAKNFILQADRERLKTALVNILVNALQAMPKGGTLNLITNSKRREIIISDTGQGISKKDLEHVFDLFYTTKQNGTGLGLATAYKIVRQHKADLGIESTENEGTSVIIKWAEE